MSEHEWVQEQIAAEIIGGLTDTEKERFDAHIHECADCATALADTRQLDRELDTLFAPVRPGPALEERTIQALWETKTPRRKVTNWKRNFAIGIAASVGIGAAGTAALQMAGFKELPLPGAVDGELWTVARSPRAVGHLDSPLSIPSTMENNPHTSIVPGVRDPEAQAREFAARTWDWTKNEAGASKEWERRESKAKGQEYLDDLAVQAQRSGSRYGYAPASPGGSSSVPLAQSELARDESRKSRGFVDAHGAVTAHGDGTVVQPNPQTPALGDARADEVTTEQSATRKTTESLHHYFVPANQKPAEMPANPALSKLPYTNRLFIQNGAKEPAGEAYKPSLTTGQFKPAEQLNNFDPKHFASTDLALNPQPPSTTTPETNTQAATRKIVIRSGDIEFEVESFDAATATVTKLVNGIKGAFVATVNSDKLPNGKVKGSIVVRVPPENLDALVLELRQELGKGGELKRLKIGSQDITKQYTDLESRLRAARAMEQRLLQMIKDGKGEIKQLLEAEKELGVWRTRIEECEGELRYYGNLVSLSTLTITMAEKEIRSAAVLTEIERVQAGIEVEDVDTARQQALAAVAAVKGRVIKSELKQLAAGQFNASLQFEVANDAAGPIRDRLRQLGRMARLEIDRVQHAEGGTVPRDAKVVRGDAQFSIQFYNLANVAPRETATLQLAVLDVPAGYQALRAELNKANARILNAQLNEQDRQNVSAQLDFEVRRTDEAAVQAAIAKAGDVTARNVNRAPEGDNVTDSKVLFRMSLVNAARLKPRETVALAVEVRDVDATLSLFNAQVGEAKGRTVDSQVAHERSGRVTARVIYDAPLAAAPALVAKFNAAGITRMQTATRDPQAPEGQYATARFDVTLSNTELIVPKDDGLWPQVRRGLTYSMSALLVSVSWVVFALCVVLPWAVIGYLIVRLFRRLVGVSPAAPATTA